MSDLDIVIKALRDRAWELRQRHDDGDIADSLEDVASSIEQAVKPRAPENESHTIQLNRNHWTMVGQDLFARLVSFGGVNEGAYAWIEFLRDEDRL